MAKVIHKQTIPLGDYFSILLPCRAEVLAFQNQCEAPVIWYLFDSEDAEIVVNRSFVMMTTGNASDLPLGKYIGTAQFHNGDLVLHLFEDRLNG